MKTKMQPSPVKLEIFDFDGTLYDYLDEFFEHADEVTAQTIYEMRPDLFSSVDEIKKIVAESFKQHGTGIKTISKENEISFHELYDAYHAKLDANMVQITPELRDALNSLHEHVVETRGILQRCILTHSTRDWTYPALDRLEVLNEIFNLESGNVITAEDCRYPNPKGTLIQHFKNRSLVPYLKACLDHNTAPHMARIFEDSPKNLIGAAQLGMQTVFIHHGKPLDVLPPYIDYQIESVGNIKDVPLWNDRNLDYKSQFNAESSMAEYKLIRRTQRQIIGKETLLVQPYTP